MPRGFTPWNPTKGACKRGCVKGFHPFEPNQRGHAPLETRQCRETLFHGGMIQKIIAKLTVGLAIFFNVITLYDTLLTASRSYC